MKKIIAVFAPLIFIVFLSDGQTIDKSAHEAFVLTRMVSKFHVDPRPVDETFSANVFSGMLQNTDPDRMFFTKNDISKLSAYTKILDKEIKQSKTGYLTLFVNTYTLRIKQTDTLMTEISKKIINFYADEKFTVAERDEYPASVSAMRQKLYKKIKSDVLDELMDDLPANFKALPILKQKKYVDSAGAADCQKIISTLKRRINNILQSQGGVAQYVGNIYCQTIASCFDPHTEFFPPEQKENFESHLGKQPFHFGFKIKADKNGGVLIDNLEPGSPAFKGGKLNKGDKFIDIQWEGGEQVNVSNMTEREFSELLEEDNHKKALFTMKKTDGSTAKVFLEKGQVAGDDDNKVKSFVLKGNNNTVGYIYLPAFYEDWDTNNDGLNGCANDVGREILKLKKENINGLILDLRYNGGGSTEEATELAGIFIDAGPVEQIKEKGPKVYTMKDVNSGTIYDGPLVILVNGYSASATELIAGTLQDYNRAVIVGSPTYGKATAQVVLPMDTTVTFENMAQMQTENYLKVTVGKLYRVNGTSAQFGGVKPDIVLPDILDAYITKEADEPYALRPNVIEANKYYQPYAPLPLKALAAGVQTEIDTNKYFNAVKKLTANLKQQKQEKDIPLNFNEALADNDADLKDNENTTIPDVASKKYTVQNNQYEAARMEADDYFKEVNEEFTHQIAIDPYISIAYDVLTKLKTP
ncbi:carboxyl-terminal processing protease [Mucilaginibacter frigoritolerans]|uniref:Carboxyl-terminal processing protease n=1 Tax=Mucilaginibacter frigoritolerans TaxID=652788 RepID=A0A562TYM7_9SPHI|nr:carboxy terminal-processing peptidase [Mucilaginibacter frigoritolerans]TWI98685.1 carboxyl-terminal processing protease [Mucilaginibacter frigoritolerans]